MLHSSTAEQWQRWQDSGCARLTGRAGGPPLPPPPGLVEILDEVAARLRRSSGLVGREVVVDPLAELSLRARTHGHVGRGDVSCGGASRLLRCADGWVALTLARADDFALVPALVQAPVGDGDDDAWHAVTVWCGSRPTAAVEERAVLLGLPVGVAGSVRTSEPAHVSVRPWRGSVREVPQVVDLSSLWAGPLCGALLADAGLDVVKVESTTRPDGARSGPPEFFDHVNRGKRHHAVDVTTDEGRAELLALVEQADVVIEASRPRALRHLGIDRDVLERGPRVWVSITGHGRQGDAGDRVGFGDDAAVAGGLVVHDEMGPVFCADAVADPITGMVAASRTLELLGAPSPGQCVHLDLSMAAASAHCLAASAWWR